MASNSGGYLARPRLRRRFSAGLSFRGLTRFEPGVFVRPSAPAGVAWARTGARRRASCQMKNAIPPIRAMAPMPIASAVPPLSPLSEDDVDDVVTTGAVVVVGAAEVDCGTPGLNGLPPEL